MGHQKTGLAALAASLIAALLAFTLGGGIAEAADKNKQSQVKPYDYLAPIPAGKSWTGPYIGASAGWANQSSEVSVFSTESKSIICRAPSAGITSSPSTKSWVA